MQIIYNEFPVFTIYYYSYVWDNEMVWDNITEKFTIMQLFGYFCKTIYYFDYT